MKLITTFHHAKNLQRYKGKEKEEIENNKDNPGQAFAHSHYPLFEGMPPAIDDPETKYMYGNIPEEQWRRHFYIGYFTQQYY